MHTSNTVQINRRQTLVWETVVKAAAWAITTVLISVVQCYLERKEKAASEYTAPTVKRAIKQHYKTKTDPTA